MAVLSANEIVKTFQEGREQVHVLRGVSLDLHPGQVVALEGPSGSGKTTLLSIMGCILTPTAGTVTVAGEVADPERPTRLRDIRRRSIGFVFQQFNLFPALTALENVEYALNVKGVRGAAARVQSRAVLERVGLGDRKDLLPRDLSGGPKQRVGVGRALEDAPRARVAAEQTHTAATAAA